MLGHARIDWRASLATSPFTQQVEIREQGLTSGLIEIVFQTQFSEPVEKDQVSLRQRHEQHREEEAARLLHAYVKRWWSDFLQIRQSHADRVVQVFANNEVGDLKLVCGFVSVVRCREIENPMQAARFVALMPVERNKVVGAGRL